MNVELHLIAQLLYRNHFEAQLIDCANGNFFFVTKGDNNNSPDSKEVIEDQLIGKVIFKIKYIGYPAIWFNLLKTEEQIAEIEKGN